MLPKWSSIRRKTFNILFVTALALTLVIAVATLYILLPAFTQLEENALRADLQTAQTALAEEVDSLGQLAVDWAWDNQAALNEPDPAALDARLAGQRIDALVFVSGAGDVLLDQEVDPAGEPSWAEGLASGAAPWRLGGTVEPGAGLAVFAEQTWLAAVAALPAQADEAAAGGWVLVGRILDEAELARLAETTPGQLQLFRADAAELPAEGVALLPGLQESGATAVRPIGGSQIAGYTALADLSGRPALLLRLSEPRTIYNQGRARVAVFVALMLATVAGSVVLAARSLDRAMISRLEEMYGGVQRMRREKDFSRRIHLLGNDELAALAGGINDAMQTLETYTQELRENQERLVYEALHDPLTQLPNRTYFNQRLDQAMALLAVERINQVAVLFLDLDSFKLINESYDHPFGDRILVVSGERIRMVLRGDDFVARLGGDEFGVLLEDLHTTEEAVKVAQRILDDIRRPFELDGRVLFLTASVGIAMTSYLMRGEELLRNADMAMYTAKEHGKNGYAIFDAQMHNQALDRLNLENDLRRAIEQDEFVVYYQPIVSLFDGTITALEALIRWQHPERGLLLPETFIHVIKEAGLMYALNQALFRKAFAQLSEWRGQGLTELRLAINVSAQALPESGFWDLFERELYAAGIPPGAIQVEVVESEMAASIDLTLAALERLKGMGVTISVDDFGTGYSSLAYLKRLPIHCLKIDRTFIKDVIQDRNDAAIVSAMIVMAHVLQLDVVAEGVETAGQFRFLLDQSCEKAQGFLMAHPEPAEALTELLLSGRRLLPENDEEP